MKVRLKGCLPQRYRRDRRGKLGSRALALWVNTHVYGLNVRVPSNTFVEILTPDVIVLGSGPLQGD